MGAELLSPSEALKGQFELAETGDESGTTTGDQTAFRGHAFTIANIGLLLPPQLVSEVADDLPLCKLPNTLGSLHGMVNLRGNMVPLFDFNHVFGIERTRKAGQRMLFIRLGEEWIGVLIDELPVRVTLSREDRLQQAPVLPEALQPFVRACYRTDQLWVDWDMDGFLTAIAGRS